MTHMKWLEWSRSDQSTIIIPMSLPEGRVRPCHLQGACTQQRPHLGLELQRRIPNTDNGAPSSASILFNKEI